LGGEVMVGGGVVWACVCVWFGGVVSGGWLGWGVGWCG